MLGYWWSDQPSITLNNVSVRYSNSTGTTTKTETKSEESSKGGEVTEVTGDIPTKDQVNAMSSKQIVENIKVGWNLGNSLDSHDTNSRNRLGQPQDHTADDRYRKGCRL